MRGVSGIQQTVELFDLTVQIGNQPMRVLAVAMPANSEIIIGRDVLNQLKITLDGFSSYTSIETLFD